MATHTSHRSKSRSVGYQLSRTDCWTNDDAIRTLFEHAKRDGVIFEFYCGRDVTIWWNGWPGPAMRALVAAIEKESGGMSVSRTAWTARAREE
ncbi:MAG: hypothetical protein ACHREM_08975 [Polyangiales bacterium]